MIVDKKYCMSSYLMYRTIADDNYCFKEGYAPRIFHVDFQRTPIMSSDDLYNSIESQVKEWTKDGKAALALSGGIDSAIIAKFMPKGSKAYTFKCVVPGIDVINEVPKAALYAEECGLEHEVVEMYWEDFERYAPILMGHKGTPIHSIEVQIYKAALKAKEDGFERLIFGESCDATYGGLSGLMSKDWLFGEFVDRYTFTKPYMVLKESQMILEPYKRFEKNGYINAHEFCRNFFLEESVGSYVNACECAGIEIIAPYMHTYLAKDLDFSRVRRGENKYIVRELFSMLYPTFEVPPKTPMPRPVDEWLKDWEGPTRAEFFENCVKGLSGDQKWQVWALERFLDMLEAK